MLPSPSLMTSLSSCGLEGHMAEIHRRFSLLGRGRLSCHNMQRGISQGQGSKTGASRSGYEVQTRDPGHEFSAPGPAPQPCSQT